MAQGKKIGEFSLKSALPTFTPGPGNAIAVQVNYEGPVTGEMAGGGTKIAGPKEQSVGPNVLIFVPA